MRHTLSALLLCFAFFANAQVNLNAGLIAYYPFNGNTLDASGNGNNAVNYGATLTTDQYGNPNSAYYFNGTSNFMQVANSPSLNPQNAITICARVYPTGYYQGLCYNNMIICKNNTDYVPGNYSLRFVHSTTIDCYIPDTNFQNFRIDLTTSCSNTVMNNTPYIQKNTWYCVIGIFDGANFKMYVNGVLRYQCNIGTTTIGTNNNDVFIGKLNNTQYPYWFNGKMDEIRLYNRALNTQEIDSLCSYIPPPDTVINKYGAVLSRQPCDNIISVDTATDFSAGDTILMVQMKGAVIDSSNSPAFGTVQNYRGSGNYEYNVIKAKNGNNLTLKYKIVHPFDIPDGKVQIVRVPSYQNYTVNTPHTCLPWNGSKGGVFAVYVNNTLTLNDDINVSGKGFRGGQINHGTTYSCNHTDFYYPASGNDGGIKGEGIALVSDAKMRGMGRLANGGGGGNNTNAGGGGGSNAGIGGDGGHQWIGCDTSLPLGGKGGKNLAYSVTSGKMFLGGGGGCGHENNGNTDPAGNGGGIVLIHTTNLAGNGHFIKLNGTSCIDNNALPPAAGDGQSGGGAGGTLLLKAASITSQPNIEAKGGNGGGIHIDIHGPGGGGSGGAVLFAGNPVSPSGINLAGGTNGMVDGYNISHDAQPGAAGQVVSGLQFTFPVDTFRPNVTQVNFTDSIVSCYTRKFKDASLVTTTGIASWLWIFPGGSTAATQTATFTFPGYGTFPVKLIVTDSNGCKDSIVKNIIIPYVHFANAGNDTVTCIGVPAILHASGGVTYSWSPATGLTNPNAAMTNATITAPADFIVTVTNAIGCIDKDTVHIGLIPGAVITAAPEDTAVCPGKKVTLSASGGLSYSWSPASGLDNANIASPVATVNTPVTYIVAGTAANGCIVYDTIRISIRPAPPVSATSDGKDITCYQSTVQLFAHGGQQYIWAPAALCDDSTSASPVVHPSITTVFTVTGTDAWGCIATDTITVHSYKDAMIFVPDAFTPNGDGLNDAIRPRIFCEFEFEGFYVFNRWGATVYQTNHIQDAWDGTFNGAAQPMGVYFYMVKGHNSSGESLLLKGNFTLVR